MLTGAWETLEQSKITKETWSLQLEAPGSKTSEEKRFEKSIASRSQRLEYIITT